MSFDIPKMLPFAFSAIVLAGAVSAFTPAGFEPASSNNLTVAFGSILAVNGVNLPMNGESLAGPILSLLTLSDTTSAPQIGTTTELFGTYTIMMVDPDIPPAQVGGATTELLHWMQPGLVSANATSQIGGVKVFQLINPSNVSAIATYIQPSPPNKSPTTHRYVQMLLNTTGNGTAVSTLAKFGATRGNFSAVNVVESAGLTVLAGNSFNVSANTAAAGNGTAANGTSSSSAKVSSSTITRTSTVAASGTGSSTGTATITGNGATMATYRGVAGDSLSGSFIAGLGALAAAVVLL